MKQLGTLDAAFVNLENPITPQHVGGLGLYDPATAPGGFVRFKDVLANFDQRLSRLPLFRTRLVEVAGGIDYPYWVEDPDYDVEFHIRHIALPKPGDWRQLCIQIARLHSRPIDMTRPLWEAYVIEGLDKIEGLPEGAFAIYTKMHHSLVDGAGGTSFMSAIHDLEPEPDYSQSLEPQVIISDRQPTQVELMARAMVHGVKGAPRNVRSIGSALTSVAKYGADIARKKIPLPEMTAPKTRFNGKVGPHRVAEALALDLQDIKHIKNATGSTVNDVCLAVVSGGLRHYLQQKHELPEQALMCGIPLDMRQRVGETDEKNQVGSTFASLHTDIDDPLERLRAISASMRTAKQDALQNPMVDMLRISGFFTPVITRPLARFWQRNQVSRLIPLNISTVITNVPGPNFPLFCAGAKMVRYHGLGLLTPGCGLFHAIFSSMGVVTLTILADRNMMPDPDVYIACLQQSFDELHEAAVGKSTKENRQAIQRQKKAIPASRPTNKTKAKARPRKKVVPENPVA